MFISLHIPHFPVVAALRADPADGCHPCAVLASRGAGESQEKLPLLAINARASMAGVQAGWPLNRALVRCPDLKVMARDLEAEIALREELIELGETIGPDLEVTAADAVTVDLSTRGQPLGEDVAGLVGAEIWSAQAPTPDLSHLAARHQATKGRVIGPADLAPLPLEILSSLATENGPLALLELWGIRSLGDFMAFPRQALTERLGAEAGLWHDLLHGKSCRLLRLHRVPESFAQSFDCEHPVTSVDVLIFTLKRMLYSLANRLHTRHLAANLLIFKIRLESGNCLEKSVRLPEPQSQVEGLLSPLQVWLESLRLEAPIVQMHLDAETTFAVSAQREWFGRQLPQPERFAETLAKLDALLGVGRVGVPAHGPSHEVDSSVMLPAMGAVRSGKISRTDCPVPLRRFRPPRCIAVANEMRHGRPWPLALLNGPHPGEIIDWRGPFPASGNWWRPDASWQRLEWDIQLASRHLLRLVFQPPDAWQLDGIYP